MIVIEIEKNVDKSIQDFLDSLPAQKIHKIKKRLEKSVDNRFPIGTLNYFNDVLIKVMYGLTLKDGKITTYSSETAPGLSEIPDERIPGCFNSYLRMHEEKYDINHLPTTKEFKEGIERLL